jgi:ubiquinone/menaquinone biosynthesis C-methylase UbiE
MGSEEVKEVWKNFWLRDKGREVFLDEMSGTILKELLRHCGTVQGKKILEAGSGRGVISAEIAKLGAEVSLLDISPDAIDIARKHFASRGVYASFIQGDVLDLPFGEMTFDIVWNAGVLEHFEEEPQVKILRNIENVIKPGGLFITFNPSDDAFFYKIGKRYAEKKGRWPYGPEFPVTTLKGQCRAAGLTVVSEYPICFKENLTYLSYISKFLRSVLKRITSPFPDDLLIRVFGGYLLVTVAVRGL